MIADTSAVMAVLLGEGDAGKYGRALVASPCRMSVANFLEATLVLESRRGSEASYQRDALIENAGIVLEPVTLEQANTARQAWRRFGKGNHPAGLNFGDCFVYAPAQTRREPLLFKGEDFARTDIEAA